MKLKTLVQLLLPILGAMAGADTAQAQFPGDVYFEMPSSVVAQGDSIELDVLFFAGTDATGAVAFDIVYDPAQVELEDTTAPDSAAADRQYVFPAPGRARVVTLNDDSLDQPFGVSAVATLRLRPLVPAGQTISIVLESQGAVTAPGVPYSQSNGFGAQISVVSPITQGSGVGSGSLGIHASLGKLPVTVLESWTVPHPISNAPIPVRRLGASIQWTIPMRTDGALWDPFTYTVTTIDPTAPTE